MIKSLLFLSLLCNFLCLSMETPKYRIMVHGEVTPRMVEKQLDFCRHEFILNSDVLLYEQNDKFGRFTELIDELCLETPSEGALDTLVKNYVATRPILISREEQWLNTAWLSAILISIARTPIGDIERKMIKTYESEGSVDSTILGIPSLFAITNMEGIDITNRLAGKLTPEKTTEYVVKFKDDLIEQLIMLPPIPIIEGYARNLEDYKEKLNKFFTERYQNDISSVINKITALKTQIFTDPILTKIHFTLQFDKRYIDNIVQERVDKLIPGIPPRSVSPGMVTPILLTNTSPSYTEENITLVSGLEQQLNSCEDTLKTKVGAPFSDLNKADIDKISYFLNGYVHMYQVFIFSPYR